MISLMDKQRIIIDGFLGGKSQWGIHRETEIDRKTIRKYINEYEEKRSNLLKGEGDKLILTEEIIEAPKYDSSNRIRVKLTDEIMDKIDFYLKENEEKKKQERANSRRRK